MTRIYLMRHGETQWNRDHNRYCGLSDIALSPHGVEQADLASTFMKSVPIDLVYASNLERAVHTAMPFAEQRQLTVIQDRRLTEIDFGLWDGLKAREIVEQYPDIWKNWCNDPVVVRAGDTGETAASVYKRMFEFMTDQYAKQPDKRILVVSHSTAIRILVAGILGMALGGYRKLNIYNTSVSVLEVHEEEMRILLLNSRYDSFG